LASARPFAVNVPLDEGMAVSPPPDVDVVALDVALEALSAVDARKSRVVELRFFGGLTVEETAEVLQVSTDTVKRDWRLAKMWLLREIEGADGRRSSRRPSGRHARTVRERADRK
jgi:DNA-directed RNA polymerase specialized sigma24 family protein